VQVKRDHNKHTNFFTIYLEAKVKKLSLICVVVLVAISQIYAQSETELMAMFNENNKEFAQLMIDNDLEGMLEYYAENSISLPSYQPMLRGLDAMRESHKKQHQSGMKVTAFELTATDVIADGNLAIEIGTYTISMIMPEMGTMDDQGKYINVWENQGGDWKLRADMWNTDLNPMMMGEEHGEKEM
jgi:ketosteroid isomerase-like protein